MRLAAAALLAAAGCGEDAHQALTGRVGRLLAYVYAGQVLVNEELLRRGFAQPLTVPPNVRHAEEFRRVADEARRAGSGLWASCAS